MKIAFHGAARTVTGSKHLITLADGRKILLDCGLFQGMGNDTQALNSDLGFNAMEVDAMLLSHAHIDHSGLIPKLVKDGFRGSIYCTDATQQLASLLLADSAQIQVNDAKYHNKASKAQGRPFIQPLYTAADAEQSFTHFVPHAYGKWFPVLEGVEAKFTDAGHIIGSACVHIRLLDEGRQKQISFSGDLGRYRDVILNSPETFSQADYIIIESTYGDTEHEDVITSVDTLREWITKTCIEKGGKLIIPAFSLGRTQEILYALNGLSLAGRLPAVDYFIDSPLSTSITDVVKRFPDYFNETIQDVMKHDRDPFNFSGLHHINSVEESKDLNYRDEPCVIVSASGMADAGRVKHHISNNIESNRNGILMTGYCEPRSLGGRLLGGAEEVGIFGVRHQVHASIGSIKSMSAHGDYHDLLQWLSCQDKGAVRQLFLVHGESSVQEVFRDRLMKTGFKNVTIPDQHEEIDLL